MTPDPVAVATARLMTRFASLGNGPAFSLAQQEFGIGYLNLLQFCELATADLVRMLENGFAQLDEPRGLEVRLTDRPDREYVMFDRACDLAFHTRIREGEADEMQLASQQALRIAFLRRRLLETLASGDKIFVYATQQPAADEWMQRLHVALRGYGNHALLWVEPADDEELAGSVRPVATGVVNAWIARAAFDQASSRQAFAAWYDICAKAWRLLHGAGP